MHPESDHDRPADDLGPRRPAVDEPAYHRARDDSRHAVEHVDGGHGGGGREAPAEPTSGTLLEKQDADGAEGSGQSETGDTPGDERDENTHGSTLGPLHRRTGVFVQSSEMICRMDATDREIIDILRADGRASFSEVGRRIGLSTNATAARVRRLERDGVIVGYRAVLASDTADPAGGLEAFVDVRLGEGRDSEEFLAWALRMPEIRDAVHVTGAYDYLVNLRVSGTPALDRLLRRLKTDGGATLTQTRLALR